MSQQKRSDDVTATTVGAGSAPTPTSLTDAQSVLGQRYRIESLAGEGGMGQVFRAFDTTLKRRVAIKFLQVGDQYTDGSNIQHRLLSEAQAMAGLRHPNLCRVLEVGLEGSRPFMVMDWIDGIPLTAAWKDLSTTTRVPLFLKVVDAVAALHDSVLVHRDLKPANILVDRSGEPVIVDFGLAQSARAEDSSRWGGTPGYAAPEQFEVSPRTLPGPASDVFALGVILYELLTNRRPFVGDATEDVLRAVREADPVLPEMIAPETPPPLQRICLAALERDARRRYPAARDLSDDLRRYLRNETVSARPSILADRFVDELQRHIELADQWSRQGLITTTEQQSLRRVLTSLQRPESPWIVDARRLTGSQVSLYVGGWLVLVGMSVGLWRTWEVLPELVRACGAGLLTIVLIGLGLFLHSRRQRRVSVIYGITGALAIPIAVILLCKQTHILTGGSQLFEGKYPLGQGAAEVFAQVSGNGDVREVPPAGLYNMQMLTAAGIALATCLGLRRVTSSSAFTALGIIFVLATWIGGWLVGGGLRPPREAATWSSMGMWLFPLGALLLISGLVLSTREELTAARVGRHNQRRSDAWSILSGGVLVILASLSLIAYFTPERYIVPRVADSAVARNAAAFMMNGCMILVMCWLLGRTWSVARDRLGDFLRWLVPSHFLFSLYVLEHENVAQSWWLWLAMLVVTCVIFCSLSVWWQWKPFLLNALAYLSLTYWQAFNEIETHAPDSGAWKMAATGGLVGIGLTVMLIAWRAPGWIAGERMKRLLDSVRTSVGDSQSRPQT